MQGRKGNKRKENEKERDKGFGGIDRWVENKGIIGIKFVNIVGGFSLRVIPKLKTLWSFKVSR